ncbi:MAG: glucosamine-6-phosphate deaminase [Pirellulales bacterium]|nr:glucosamine-6-phosphate deaminase [Pirellulales bacterium]
MQTHVYPTPTEANNAASQQLSAWLTDAATRTVMLAAGNTPLELYRLIAQRQLSLSHLTLFALDEYVGVPLDEPRNCANLLRRTAVQPWGVPESQYHYVSSDPAEAASSVKAHEERIAAAGGLDVLILGLGQNAHLGFNEPGSAEDGPGRLLDLDAISIEANRQWYGGDYAPAQGATVGMKAILAARKILIMAYGPHKRAAVRGMLQGPRGPACPASLLRGHPAVHVYLDEAAVNQTSVNHTAEGEA